MDNDNLKNILAMEHEAAEKINEEQVKFDFKLIQYKSEFEKEISSFHEKLKQDLEIFKEECKKELESKYEEDLKNIEEHNRRIKNLDFSFLQKLIKPYLIKMLD